MDAKGYDVARLVFQGLTTTANGLNVVGAAARSWTSNHEGRVFTFTLRDDMKFTNGDPVDTDAFAFARLADTDAASPPQSLG